jgi:hypothetical protein
LKLADAISAAAQPTGSSEANYAARHSVKIYWEPRSDELLQRAIKQLKNPELQFDLNFEEIAGILKNAKGVSSDWEEQFGIFIYDYFKSIVAQLEREKFIDDEMLQEGFLEAVPKSLVKLRVVEKITVGTMRLL